MFVQNSIHVIIVDLIKNNFDQHDRVNDHFWLYGLLTKKKRGYKFKDKIFLIFYIPTLFLNSFFDFCLVLIYFKYNYNPYKILLNCYDIMELLLNFVNLIPLFLPL